MLVRNIKLPSISFIVARSYPNYIIGCENRLPWHLRTDLQNFKKLTKNKAIIMGRKTFDSIGKPLPNRRNIVLTRDASGLPESVEAVENIESALFCADLYTILQDQEEFFVIGGDQIYKLFQEFYNKIYLTEVYSPDIVGDAHFDFEYDGRRWATVSETEYPRSENDDYPFRITVLERRNKHTRVLELTKFYTDLSEKAHYVDEMQKKRLEKKILTREVLQKEFFSDAEYA